MRLSMLARSSIRGVPLRRASRVSGGVRYARRFGSAVCGRFTRASAVRVAPLSTNDSLALLRPQVLSRPGASLRATSRVRGSGQLRAVSTIPIPRSTVATASRSAPLRIP